MDSLSNSLKEAVLDFFEACSCCFESFGSRIEEGACRMRVDSLDAKWVLINETTLLTSICEREIEVMKAEYDSCKRKLYQAIRCELKLLSSVTIICGESVYEQGFSRGGDAAYIANKVDQLFAFEKLPRMIALAPVGELLASTESGIRNLSFVMKRDEFYLPPRHKLEFVPHSTVVDALDQIMGYFSETTAGLREEIVEGKRYVGLTFHEYVEGKK